MVCMHMLTLLIASFVAGTVPLVVSAQNMTWVNSVAGQLLAIFDKLVVLLVALALLIFIYGIVKFILVSGDEESHEEGRRRMAWGVIALFVIMSVWGLVHLLSTLAGIPKNKEVSAPQIVPYQSASRSPSGNSSSGGNSAGGSGGGTTPPNNPCVCYDPTDPMCCGYGG